MTINQLHIARISMQEQSWLSAGVCVQNWHGFDTFNNDCRLFSEDFKHKSPLVTSTLPHRP